jgi:superfamily I DNA and RNA helicase
MHDFIQNAVNNLYQANELTALKAEVANLKADADQSKAEVARLRSASFVTAVSAEEYERLQSENLLVREESDRHYQLWVDRGHEIDRLNSLIGNSEHESARKIHGLQQDNEALQKTVDRLEADKS